jgi:exopolysaccharide production protein ExoZ
LGKLRSLEMLRAVAALLVVMFHAQFIFGVYSGHVPFGGVFITGNRGVDLFFVLSGFIIAYVHAGDIGRPDRLANYVYNRLARIFPAVWIMTALAMGLYVVGFGGGDRADKLAPAAVLASSLLLPQSGTPLVNVTWTLTYELFFYALFAVLIVSRWAGLALLLAWQAAIVVLALDGADLGLPGYYLRSLCLEFSVGLGCAWWLRRPAGRLPAGVWGGTLLGGMCVFVLGLSVGQDGGGIPCALGAGAIIVGLVRLEQAGRMPVSRVLERLGQASYAIYLVHYSVLTLMAAVLIRTHILVDSALVLACAACAVLAGVMFDQWLDQPIQRGLRQVKRRLVRPGLMGAEHGA